MKNPRGTGTYRAVSRIRDPVRNLFDPWIRNKFFLHPGSAPLEYSSFANQGCLSRILIFVHPGSKNSKWQQKTGLDKNFVALPSFCSHKYHKIEYYFIFELV